jgi:hypothetical protein
VIDSEGIWLPDPHGQDATRQPIALALALQIVRRALTTAPGEGIQRRNVHEAVKRIVAEVGALCGFSWRTEYDLEPPRGPVRLDVAWSEDSPGSGQFKLSHAFEV